jgi:ABC-type bacteriocin/lantibiotic exporter with double-glycine peptidase domain
LEAFANAAHMTFDRILAGRVLGEAERAIPGDDAQTWARRLVEVGESLNLRIRYMECTVSEILSFVRQGVPVAFCEDSAEGELRWNVMEAARGRKIRLASLDAEPLERWVTQRQLRRLFHEDTATSRVGWVIGQAALGCQSPGAPSSHQSHETPLSPLARLVGFLRPEKKDLWVVLVFSLVVGVLALASPVAVEALVNTVAFGKYMQPVVILALMLFTFLAFAAAIRALITFVVEILQRRLFIRVVEDLAYRLPRVEQREFDKEYGPETVNRFFDIVTVQKSASALLLDGISIVLQTVVGMTVLAFYHPFLLGFDVLLLALIAFIVFALGRGAVKTAIQESRAKYAVAEWLEELARHTTAFKLHSGSQFGLERADQLAVNWLDARRQHFRVVMRQILFALGLQAVGATILLGLGGWLVIMGELTLGQLVAAELIVMMIVGSFAKLGKHMESFYDLLAAIEKLGHLFDLKTEPHDKVFHLGRSGPAAVALEQVQYSYDRKIALREISLEVSSGESVALTGGSGSGKSTLIELLCGLRPPSSGHIELDGIDIREIRPDSLREHLALARGIDVFHATIDENVHLNRPNIQANDVRDALQMVGLLDEVLRLPDGLNTMLQTGGAPLSSTQALRLMLARALVGRPRLLLIDGTLDGLSDQVATDVLARLTRRRTPWTLIVSTGRQSVMEACDRVIWLDAGRIQQRRSTSAALT